VRDKDRFGQPKKFEDVELQELLDENQAQTLLELSKALTLSILIYYTPMAVFE